MTALGAAATAKYLLLTSFRKDGTPVGTPVWAVVRDDRIYTWSEVRTGKVKRIRRNPSVTVQACDARGKTTRGEVVAGSARLLDDAETEQVRGWLRRKYWLTAPLMMLASRVFRGKESTIGIEITPA